MAENEWMLDEFERAAERTRDLPAHARPIVTRPLVNGRRVPQRSQKAATLAFKRGDRVNLSTHDGEFRVMAVADGYAMLRRPGCIPFVAVLNALAAAGAAQPPPEGGQR